MLRTAAVHVSCFVYIFLLLYCGEKYKVPVIGDKGQDKDLVGEADGQVISGKLYARISSC